MSILGSLSVNLIADTKRWVSGFGKAEKTNKRFGKSVKGADSLLKKYGTTIAGVLSVRALGGFVKETFASIDALEKQADRLGVSTHLMRQYQHAATLGGVSTDQMVTALERMRDTMGAALMGESGAQTVFEKLGLAPELLQRSRNPLQDILRALNRINDISTRMALARDIFGRGGAGMLNVSMEKVNEFFNRYVGHIDDSNEKVQAMHDKWAEVRVQVMALSDQLALLISPKILAILQELQRRIKQINDLRQQPFTPAQQSVLARLKIGMSGRGRVDFGELMTDARDAFFGTGPEAVRRSRPGAPVGSSEQLQVEMRRAVDRLDQIQINTKRAADERRNVLNDAMNMGFGGIEGF